MTQYTTTRCEICGRPLSGLTTPTCNRCIYVGSNGGELGLDIALAYYRSEALFERSQRVKRNRTGTAWRGK